MRAPLVALAFACGALAAPGIVRADPIRASAGSSACALDVRASSDWHPDQPWASPIVTVDHSARLDDDDATFRTHTGLDNSAHFANTGSLEVWGDDRTRLDEQIDFDGFGLSLHKHITIALRKHFGKHGPKHGGTIKLPRADADPGSPTPEPESILLIATGLAGAFVFRRQLFA